MMKKSFKVKIPRDARGLMLLAGNIVNAHKKQGNESPLDKDLMEKFENLVVDCKALQNEAESIRRESLRVTEDRNKLMGRDQFITNPDSVYQNILKISKLLSGHFFTEEQKMGDFGFDVVRSKSTSIEAEEENHSLSRADIIDEDVGPASELSDADAEIDL